VHLDHASPTQDKSDLENLLPNHAERLVRRNTHSSRDDQHTTSNPTADDDTDASDNQDPQQKLNRLRLFSVVEIVGYVYRSALPLPLWGYYFSVGGRLSIIFMSLYFILKAIDLSWKFKGAVEAVETYLGQKLVSLLLSHPFHRSIANQLPISQEFGHYSTAAEYNPETSSYDCPICYDSPKKAVTLECNHIFCEPCICEWLEKEKSCPVCRVEVKSSSPILVTLKQEVHSSNHVLL
jgi:hypothetical protein